jgi:2-methylcitrate dehydratase PrpD
VLAVVWKPVLLFDDRHRATSTLHPSLFLGTLAAASVVPARMRVLITGARGCVGKELAKVLAERGSLRGVPIKSLVLLDWSELSVE